VGGNNAGKSTVCEALDLVLGPERLYRRPIVDEHDFHQGRYINGDGSPVEIQIEALLVDLSDEAEIRFHRHLRRWNEKKGCFADETGEGPAAGDENGTCWALPVRFIGRYDPEEDDFIGNTFFAHPIQDLEEEDEENRLGAGLKLFARDSKRLCGFVFLRSLRTGSRALSLQRGSLLDTVLKLGGSGLNEMWQDSLSRLRKLDPAIGEIPQLKKIRSAIETRMTEFVNLSKGPELTAFFASNLTRDHLREVVRFFIGSEYSGCLIPFQRLGTGAVNMLVFALLTFIAELKEKKSVIFAMEEPEIALPPYTQRRVVRFVLGEMGQAVVTSHSPYIIEQFEPEQIVMVTRNSCSQLRGTPIDVREIKPKIFKAERKQFAEAILGRAVLIVEGSTESGVFLEASSVMESSLGANHYNHLDLAGVSIFNAGGEGSVPRYGPIFKALGKLTFAFYDKSNQPIPQDSIDKLSYYTRHWESPFTGTENLLVNEMDMHILKNFLNAAKNRFDYPRHLEKLSKDMSEQKIKELTTEVLRSRKGDANAYASLLIRQCTDASQLPRTIRTILEEINQITSSIAGDPKESCYSNTNDYQFSG
jgi:putative ATP-dependent endonuclease of OLD family